MNGVYCHGGRSMVIIPPSPLMCMNTAGSLHPSPLPGKTIKVASKEENIQNAIRI